MSTITFTNGFVAKIEWASSPFITDWVALVRSQPEDAIRLDNYDLSVERFNFLRTECDRLLGWIWSDLALTQENFNLMHKDLERLALIDQMPPIDHPAHELHQILHWLEDHGIDGLVRLMDMPLQDLHFKNYNDGLIPITDFSIFKKNCAAGSIILDYPYVGRSPMSACEHRDSEEVSMTCRAQVDANAGFRICLTPNGIGLPGLPALSQWLDGPGRPIADKYTKELVINTAGPAVVGCVINTDELLKYRKRGVLQIEKIEI